MLCPTVFVLLNDLNVKMGNFLAESRNKAERLHCRLSTQRLRRSQNFHSQHIADQELKQKESWTSRHAELRNMYSLGKLYWDSNMPAVLGLGIADAFHRKYGIPILFRRLFGMQCQCLSGARINFIVSLDMGSAVCAVPARSRIKTPNRINNW